MSTDWSAAIDRSVDRRFDELVALRRHFHVHPEPSGQELETSLQLYQRLSDQGFTVQMGPEGRGVVADAPFGGAARTIAVRADLDALKIQDRKHVNYRSRRAGVMHACGHDAHMAIAFGTLIVLRDLAQADALPWPVNVRGIFQPAEETARGARDMIDAGCLDGVQAVLATHVDPTQRVGVIAVRPGVLTANCDAMRMTVRGRGGHAARPHESNDPIAAAAQLISTLYLFIPRATDSQDAVVVTIGQVQGGDNPNVIPEQVELFGTLRTLDRTVRQQTIEHIRQLARGIEEMSRTKIEVRFEASVRSVRNDPLLTRLIEKMTEDLLGADGLHRIDRPSMGSEDFANYLEHVPGAMFRIGASADPTQAPQLHTPTFDVDERALAIGAKMMARTVVKWSQPEES